MPTPDDIDNELVARLVSSLRQCEADGWQADMGNYGFIVGYNRAITPTGGKCCFLGAEMLKSHRGYQSPTWDKSDAICSALGLSNNFVIGFNRAVVTLQLSLYEEHLFPHPDTEIQRGQAHGIAAYWMWKGGSDEQTV